MKQVLSLHPDVDGKYELDFILGENEPSFLGEDLDLAILNKIGEKLVMMPAEYLRHELVDIEGYHILVVMPKELTNVFGNLPDFTSLLNHIDVDYALFGAEYILVFLFEQPPFQVFLLGYDPELLLPRPVGLQVLIEDEDKEAHPERVRVIDH